MVAAKGSPFKVHLTTNQQEAVAGASYVTTQLRVGWMQARREDEYLGRRHGLIGQETTGVGGMAKALRTIPVVLNIARDMNELAPDSYWTTPSRLKGATNRAFFASDSRNASHRAKTALVEGERVISYGDLLAQHMAVTMAFCVVLTIIGYFFLRTREIAA